MPTYISNEIAYFCPYSRLFVYNEFFEFSVDIDQMYIIVVVLRDSSKLWQNVKGVDYQTVWILIG